MVGYATISTTAYTCAYLGNVVCGAMPLHHCVLSSQALQKLEGERRKEKRRKNILQQKIKEERSWKERGKKSAKTGNDNGNNNNDDSWNGWTVCLVCLPPCYNGKNSGGGSGLVFLATCHRHHDRSSPSHSPLPTTSIQKNLFSRQQHQQQASEKGEKELVVRMKKRKNTVCMDTGSRAVATGHIMHFPYYVSAINLSH